MSYERLQITDHVDKWDVAKVQHLENAIIANEAAIDNGADWETLKNKPFSEESNSVVLVENAKSNEHMGAWDGYLPEPLIAGDLYIITINNKDYEVIPYDAECGDRTTFEIPEEGLVGFCDKSAIEDGYFCNVLEGDFTISIVHKTTSIKHLDDKFISDNIARVADLTPVDTTLAVEGAAADAKAVGEAIANVVDNIPEQVQVDWDQSDETATDYIKNRTHYKIPIYKTFGSDFVNGDSEYFVINNEKYVKIFDGILDFENKDTKIHNSDNNELVTIDNHVPVDTTTGEIVGMCTSKGEYVGFNYNDSCYIRAIESVHSSTYEDIYYLCYRINACIGYEYNTLDVEYLPEIPTEKIPHTIARTTSTILEDITETPTAEQYNALLQVLRDAGILAIE